MSKVYVVLKKHSFRDYDPDLDKDHWLEIWPDETKAKERTLELNRSDWEIDMESKRVVTNDWNDEISNWKAVLYSLKFAYDEDILPTNKYEDCVALVEDAISKVENHISFSNGYMGLATPLEEWSAKRGAYYYKELDGEIHG